MTVYIKGVMPTDKRKRSYVVITRGKNTGKIGWINGDYAARVRDMKYDKAFVYFNETFPRDLVVKSFACIREATKIETDFEGLT